MRKSKKMRKVYWARRSALLALVFYLGTLVDISAIPKWVQYTIITILMAFIVWYDDAIFEATTEDK